MERDVKPERVGRFEINDQVELSRPLHRKISRLFAFEDAVDVGGGTPGIIVLVSAVRY
jgi:hypothetical protein